MRIFFIAFIFLFSETTAQPVALKDLEFLNGNWKGVLQYKDYLSGKLTEISAAITIRQESSINSMIFFFEYPMEPSHNSFDTMRLSADGKYLNKQKILSIDAKNGAITFITESTGRDNNKPAIYHNYYEVSGSAFNQKKMVRPEGAVSFFLRSE